MKINQTNSLANCIGRCMTPHHTRTPKMLLLSPTGILLVVIVIDAVYWTGRVLRPQPQPHVQMTHRKDREGSALAATAA